MLPFTYISPKAAADLISMAELGEPMTILADFGLAGRIRAYADWMEKLQPNGHREEIRNKCIPAELWRRIIHEGKTGEVATGTVRLEGSSEFGGGPKWTIVGIRFNDVTLHRLIAEHATGHVQPIIGKSPPAPPPTPVSPIKETVEVAVKPEAKRREADPAAITPGALTATVKQTMAATGLGRTTINKLMNDETLVRVPVGRRTLITVASIRALIGENANPSEM